MAKKTKSEERKPDQRFARVAEAFALDKSVTSGFMMSSFGLKVKGKIFAMYGRNQFVVKLPKHRVDELVKQGSGKRFDPGHGRLMKEWIVIQKGPKVWVLFAEEAYAFVKSIKPK